MVVSFCGLATAFLPANTQLSWNKRKLCVHRDMKHLGSLESTQEARATPRATLTHLSCSPNFPRASYLDERTRTYEPVVNYDVHEMSIVELSIVRKLIYLICFDFLQSKWYRNALVGVPDDKTNSEKRFLWQTLYVWLKNVKTVQGYQFYLP